MKNTKNTITLVVNGHKLVFEPNMTAYNGMINDMSMDNKITPIVTYLRRIVTPESKEALSEILDIPGSAMQLAEKINAEYAPKLDIELKN